MFVRVVVEEKYLKLVEKLLIEESRVKPWVTAIKQQMSSIG
jgi:hypothetical protein